MGKAYHVSQRENGWQVKAQGAEKVLKTFKTQKEAIDYSDKIGSKGFCNRTIIHRTDGKIRK